MVRWFLHGTGVSRDDLPKEEPNLIAICLIFSKSPFSSASRYSFCARNFSTSGKKSRWIIFSKLCKQKIARTCQDPSLSPAVRDRPCREWPRWLGAGRPGPAAHLDVGILIQDLLRTLGGRSDGLPAPDHGAGLSGDGHQSSGGRRRNGRHDALTLLGRRRKRDATWRHNNATKSWRAPSGRGAGSRCQRAPLRLGGADRAPGAPVTVTPGQRSRGGAWGARAGLGSSVGVYVVRDAGLCPHRHGRHCLGRGASSWEPRSDAWSHGVLRTAFIGTCS